MLLKIRIIIGFFVIGIFVASIGSISILEFENSIQNLNSIESNIKKLNKSQNLLSYAVNIKYYDEVLTQPARNYAFTENEIWKIRYFENEPLLSKELSNALKLGTEIEKEFFQQIDNANTNLVKMESSAIELTTSGNQDEAISILESQKYQEYKEKYQNSLAKYLESRNLEYTTLMMESTKEVDASMNAAFESTNTSKIIIGVSIIIIVIGTLVLGLLISKSIIQPIKKLQNVSQQIIKGNYNVKTKIKTNDEIGELSNSFEYMIEHLKKEVDIENQLLLQQNLRNALDESSIVSIIDPNRIVTFVNDKFCEISGYSKEELIGTDQSIVRAGIHPPKFYDDLWKVISDGNVWHGEICNKAKDGSLFWNEATIVPFSDKDRKIYEYVAIRTNITHQKELSKKLVEAERLSAIGELAARIAHDIRNPLGVIKNSLGNIKLLKNDPDGIDRTINRCDRAVDRIAHQIDGVMGFLKETPLEMNRVSLTEIIKSAMMGIPEHQEIDIIVPSKNIFIFGDRIKLESLFYNLIINAIQKLKTKGIITIKSFEESNEKIVITVSDNGESIPELTIKKIFDPLVTSKQSGTGLGLASCKKIVEQHNGTISVSNDPVTFTIILPSIKSITDLK